MVVCSFLHTELGHSSTITTTLYCAVEDGYLLFIPLLRDTDGWTIWTYYYYYYCYYYYKSSSKAFSNTSIFWKPDRRCFPSIIK